MKEYNPNYLDFEQPLLEIEAKIKQLKSDPEKTAKSEAAIVKLEKDYLEQTKKIFGSLSDWQISQLHGDRMFGDDPAIISGIAKLDHHDFMFIGHQKGRDAKEKVKRNFGMPKPEGYRKALRVMKLAEKFSLPIITFIDTPGAYPGIDAESRNQSQAIAENLFVMSNLRVPIISIIIGEGGSGGALAIGVCDKLGMLENSIYSVISPEGCASILWKDAKKAEKAADALCITASKLLDFKLVDTIVPEPSGGAHRDYVAMSSSLKMNLLSMLDDITSVDLEELLLKRKQKLESYGKFESV